MDLTQMAAEEELDAFYTTPCTIYTLRCNLVSMIHFAPFLRDLDAHLVVVLHRGDASLTGLAIDATACNHFIHICFEIIINVNTYFAINEPVSI